MLMESIKGQNEREIRAREREGAVLCALEDKEVWCVEEKHRLLA